MQLYEIDDSIDIDDEEDTVEYDLNEAESDDEQETTWEWDGENWKRVD